jgi:hypothetical protein
MSNARPRGRSLESLKKEAKRWLAALQANDPEARATGRAALARYETMVEDFLDAYRTGTPEAMERLYRNTWHRRTWSAFRTYAQLDLGKRPARPGEDVDLTRDDARHLVSVDTGLRAGPARPPSARDGRPAVDRHHRPRCPSFSKLSATETSRARRHTHRRQSSGRARRQASFRHSRTTSTATRQLPIVRRNCSRR